MAYDDLYRLNKIEYNHEPGQDTWLDPFEAEHQTGPSFEKPSPSPRADFSGSTRVAKQTYQYDWLGNTTSTGDDQGAFYDRSLGQIQNGGAGASPYQLWHASNESGTSARPGHLDAQYDAMGNMVAMQVHRVGKCRPASACPGNQLDQSFFYQWDEVGRLVGAERFDGVLTSVHPAMEHVADVGMSYSYDASDQRVIKWSMSRNHSGFTAYIFNTLELRNTSPHYVGTGQPTRFEQNQDTEAVYLFGHGVRLGRVVYAMNAAAPMMDGKMVQVLLEPGDGLGSTSIVLQRGSGELVERTEHLAYGGVDSDYRPDRWGAFREPYKFTGKEEDVEVGLVYFGKRFYAPLLGRWVSADPLVVHGPGRADANLYAYVRGRVLVATDPVGLVDDAERKQTHSDTLYEADGSIVTTNPEGRVVTTLKEVPIEAQPPSGLRARKEQGAGGASGQSWRGGQEGAGGSEAASTQQHSGGGGEVVVAMSVVPGVGEGMDAAVLLDQSSSTTDRMLAGGSLCLNAALPFLPNWGALAKLARRGRRGMEALEEGTRVERTVVREARTGSRPARLKPDPDAVGPHSTFRRHGETGRVTHHAEWDEHGLPVKRTDVVGDPHGPIGTPHTHPRGPSAIAPNGKRYPGKKLPVRPARKNELPK